MQREYNLRSSPFSKIDIVNFDFLYIYHIYNLQKRKTAVCRQSGYFFHRSNGRDYCKECYMYQADNRVYEKWLNLNYISI